MNTRGKFIVIDGGEGAGKSSQIQEIKKTFGESVLITREPGGSVLADKIREVILSPEAGEANGKTQFALFWAGRSDHMRATVIPALERGINVISDRFDSSSYTYQIYGQKEEGLRDLFYKMREIYLGEYKPDLYIYMDVPVEVGLKRKQEQADFKLNHFDERDIEFHKRVREGLIDFFKDNPSVTINADREFEEVKKDLIDILKKEFEK